VKLTHDDAQFRLTWWAAFLWGQVAALAVNISWPALGFTTLFAAVWCAIPFWRLRRQREALR
jgi:hypothetical protein